MIIQNPLDKPPVYVWIARLFLRQKLAKSMCEIKMEEIISALKVVRKYSQKKQSSQRIKLLC